MGLRCLLLLLILNCKLKSILSLVNSNNEVIIDLSEVLEEAFQNNRLPENARDLRDYVGSKCSRPDGAFLALYGTDFGENTFAKLEEIMKSLRIIDASAVQCKVKFLVSMKYDTVENDIFSNITNFATTYSSYIAGFSFEEASKNNKTVDLRLRKIKSSLERKIPRTATSSVNVGYQLNYYSLESGYHNTNIEDADYIIVDIDFKPNDQIFVESYGIFRDKLENIYESLRSLNKPIYAFVRLKLQNGEKLSNGLQNVAREMLRNLSHFSFPDRDIDVHQRMSKLDNDTETRYQQLFTTYVKQWIKDSKNGTNVIVKCFLDCFKVSNESDSKIYTDIIPYFMNLPFYGDTINTTFAIKMVEATSMFLENLRSSGFSAIMIDEKTFKRLSTFKKCKTDACRPKHITCLFKEPPHLDRIEDYINVNGITMSSLYFQPQKHSWQNALCNAAKYNVTTACYAHETAIDLKTIPLDYENYNPNTKSALVWHITIQIENDRTDYFVKDTMNRLLAWKRHLLNTDYPQKQVVLHLKVEYRGYLGLDNEFQNSLFCSKLKERVGQFYEAILTWTTVHWFPVVIESSDGKSSIGNPISWERLAVRKPERMKQAMESGPIYVRRSYNHSVVFGRWTTGMYPCISKSTNKSWTSQNSEFGASLTLNSEHAIHPDYLTSRFLFALEQFKTIEIIINGPATVLNNFVMSPVFEKLFKRERMYEKTVLLHIPNTNWTHESTTKSLNNFVTRLTKIGVIVHLTHHHKIDNNLVTFAASENIKMGMEHENCSNLVYKLVFRRDQLSNELHNIDYLICESEPVLGNAENESELQDYFNLHLYMYKLFRYIYPKIAQVYFRVQFEFTESPLENTSSNLFVFLNDLNNYAKAYQINYLLSDNLIKVLANITSDNKNVYNGSLSDSTGQGTSKTPNETDFTEESAPERQSLNLLDHIPYFAGGAVFLVLILVGAIAIRFKQNKSRLTPKEVQEFYDGQMELIQQAVDARLHNTIYTGNFFDGLVYQRSFELLKQDVTTAVKNGRLLRKSMYTCNYQTRLERHQKDVVLKVTKTGCPREIFKGILSETKLLCYVGTHSNLVNFVGCHTANIQNCMIWTAMEFCEGGSLVNYLQNREEKTSDINMQRLVKFCRDIACGMQYIADQDVIHGDLSASQVLLDHNLTCKIKGLGLTGKITVYQAYIKKNQWEKLPWQWIAPESLRKLVFSAKSDAWSFGITLWEIFSLGKTPYSEATWKPGFIHDIEKGLRMECPALSTSAIFDVMSKCWDIAPDKRPDFLKLLQFFNNLMLASAKVTPLSPTYFETSL